MFVQILDWSYPLLPKWPHGHKKPQSVTPIYQSGNREKGKKSHRDPTDFDFHRNCKPHDREKIAADPGIQLQRQGYLDYGGIPESIRTRFHE